MASPRWPSVGMIFLVAGLISTVLFALFGIWFIDERQLVLARLQLVEFIESNDGRIVPADTVAKSDTARRLSWARRLLGDQAVVEIELPYGMERLRKRVESLFPEVRDISTGPSSPAMAKTFGGEGGLDVLRHPDSVRACRLEIPNNEIASPSTVGGYQTKGDEVEVPLAVYMPLSDMLLEPDSYEWFMESMCLPEFGVRMTWRRASERIDLLVCFNCSEMLIYRDTRLVRRRDIEGPLRDLLLSATKSLFPEDAAIQALKPCGSESNHETLPNVH